MPSENDFQIFWQDQLVGLLRNSRPDMWYLEGNWAGSKTTASAAFEESIAATSLKDVFNKPERRIEVSLKDNKGGLTLAVIISLTGDTIFLRRITSSLKRPR